MTQIKYFLQALTLCFIGSLTLASCSEQLEIQQVYDYALDIMPVQSSIRVGETTEIRCRLITTGNYKDTQFTIRYFQVDGKGELRLGNSNPFKPNDRYIIDDCTFRLYYTSLKEESHHIDIYIEDNFGQMQMYSFEFSNESEEDIPHKLYPLKNSNDF